MSALVERIIAARDRLKGFAIPSDDDLIEARDAMADAANAITERDQEVYYLKGRMEKLTEALTFYATAEPYEVDADRGGVASKALKVGDL